MGYNMIVLTEKQNLQHLDIGSDNLPAEVNCYMASGFHEGIYRIMMYSYDLIIITVLQSLEFTEQAIGEIRKLRNTPSWRLSHRQRNGKSAISKLGRIRYCGELMANRNYGWRLLHWFAGINGILRIKMTES